MDKTIRDNIADAEYAAKLVENMILPVTSKQNKEMNAVIRTIRACPRQWRAMVSSMPSSEEPKKPAKKQNPLKPSTWYD